MGFAEARWVIVLAVNLAVKEKKTVRVTSSDIARAKRLLAGKAG